MHKNFSITGMHCPSCENIIIMDLEDAHIPVSHISWKEEKLIVDIHDEQESKVTKIIEDAGYTVTPMEK